MSRTKRGRRPKGNPLHKLLASKTYIMMKGHMRHGIVPSAEATYIKAGWKRVN